MFSPMLLLLVTETRRTYALRSSRVVLGSSGSLSLCRARFRAASLRPFDHAWESFPLAVAMPRDL